MYNFRSTILIHPGLGNSGRGHWQTLWEKEFGFIRVNQRDWDTPDCDEWIATLDRSINDIGTNVIIVAHSLACCTIVNWSTRFATPLKAALLVAPSDTEAEIYPRGTTGFTPMPLQKLRFPGIVVTSSDDPYVSVPRAEFFAAHWGCRMNKIDNAGHINVASGFGPWPQGLALLNELDKLPDLR